MKNLFYLLLGVILVSLVSATTISVMTIKPATPKNVVCFMDYSENIKSKILDYSSKGYILKQMEIADQRTTGSIYSYIIVVMEKY